MNPAEMPAARVLILCTGNSARSQMAEGWLRHLAGRSVEVASAGTHPADQVNPLAVRAMTDAGVDISGHHPKGLQQFVNQPWDYVITVCDRANETCPYFPGGRQRLHWGFEDPAQAVGDEPFRLAVFCHIRDQIKARLLSFIASTLNRPAPGSPDL